MAGQPAPSGKSAERAVGAHLDFKMAALGGREVPLIQSQRDEMFIAERLPYLCGASPSGAPCSAAWNNPRRRVAGAGATIAPRWGLVAFWVCRAINISSRWDERRPQTTDDWTCQKQTCGPRDCRLSAGSTHDGGDIFATACGAAPDPSLVPRRAANHELALV